YLLFIVIACRPVDSFRNRDIKGRCFDINALAYANSGSAIAQDIKILILPLTAIHKLNLKRWREFAIMLMVSVRTL
ncbi:hypothetical protein K469DRAFT_521674, partial [Zopfia rhizophila CBS 207.26]